MKTKNALEILKNRLEKKPGFKGEYTKEKQNYYIALKIREYRKQAKLTQKDFAQLIGTKQSVVSRLENADYTGHSLTMLKKISTILNVPIENFLEPERPNAQELRLHIPPMFKEAASFKNWNSNQIIKRSSNAR